MIFAEPEDPSDGPFGGLAAWYRNSASSEARAARETINAWYAAFADRDTMVMSRLQSDNDSKILQAIDELYVHHLLSQSCEPRYEEDNTSPDFRLYRSSEYIAGVEVLTLFTEQDFTAEVSRNAGLVDVISHLVRPTGWYLYIREIQWRRQPRATDLARWLESTIDSLPAPATDLTRADYPTATYSSPAVDLTVTFLPRHRSTAPTATESIVIASPVVAQFVEPARRLRKALSQKGGSKYNHRDRPFAVVVSVRDYLCSIDDIVNTLYGNEAITFEIDNPDSAQSVHRRNGTFTVSPGNPEGRNRRLSCIFALMRGWMPGSHEVPTVFRFDNPFAEQAFPDDLLVPDQRVVTRRDGSGVRIEWELGTASP